MLHDPDPNREPKMSLTPWFAKIDQDHWDCSWKNGIFGEIWDYHWISQLIPTFPSIYEDLRLQKWGVNLDISGFWEEKWDLNCLDESQFKSGCPQSDDRIFTSSDPDLEKSRPSGWKMNPNLILTRNFSGILFPSGHSAHGWCSSAPLFKGFLCWKKLF